MSVWTSFEKNIFKKVAKKLQPLMQIYDIYPISKFWESAPRLSLVLLFF